MAEGGPQMTTVRCERLKGAECEGAFLGYGGTQAVRAEARQAGWVFRKKSLENTKYTWLCAYCPNCK